MDICCFGIGCYYFDFKEVNNRTNRMVLDNIVDYLESIDGISSVEVEAIQSELDSDSFYDSIDENIADCPFFKITFDVLIPIEFHDKCGRLWNFEKTINRFKIVIIKAYLSCFSLVIPMTSIYVEDPSSYVALVREYFNSKNEELTSAEAKLKFLGPSPFHVNFHMSSVLDVSSKHLIDGVSYKYIKSVGYDRCCLYYDKDKYESCFEALEDVLYNINGQFGLFYYLVNRRNYFHKKWREIISNIEDIVHMYDVENKYKQVLSFKKIGNMKIANRKLFLFELELLSEKVYFDEQRQGLEACGVPLIIQSQIVEEMSRGFEYPLSQAHCLAESVINEVWKRQDWFAYLISALSGGAIGGLLSLLLNK